MPGSEVPGSVCYKESQVPLPKAEIVPRGLQNRRTGRTLRERSEGVPYRESMQGLTRYIAGLGCKVCYQRV